MTPADEMPTINKRGIDTIMSLKKKIAAAFIACAMTLAVVPSAFACTALYVGSDLTEDGTTMFGRIEDLGTNDYNKLFNISPAGKHTAGEVYEGCYGFTYTFTHDSYRYTARRDDNGLGVCPDCDSTHEHTPYEEAGTNEKGVMVSATESLYGTDAVLSVDPYVDNGIEEAEITTVLLSEASTAREGVALLTSIYDNAGAAGGSGVFIADQNETWFVENLTGHTYLALKLSSSVVFMQPNVAAMGKIDLDDTDHVVASANLISVAQKAGTFVGDAAANEGQLQRDRLCYQQRRRERCHRPGLLQHPADQEVLGGGFHPLLSDRAHRQDGQCGDSSVPGERHRRSEHRHYRVDRF